MRFWISVCHSSMVHEGCWVNCPTRVGNLEASTVCWRESARWVQLSDYPGSGRPRSACSSGGPFAQSGGQAKKAPMSSWDFAWICHSPFKCAQDNSQSPAQMFQTMSCLAVVWSQSHLSSHSLINNLTVYNKSCYFSLINRKVNNK